MFLESLLETSAPARRRRSWATLLSFLIESAVIGALILLPLARPDALPAAVHWTEAVFTPPPSGPPPTPPPPTHGTAQAPHQIEADGTIRVPPSFPAHPYVPTSPEPPVEPTGVFDPSAPYTGLPAGVGTGPVRDVVVAPVNRPEPPPPAPVPLTSKITEGLLIYRVQPEYPRMALMIRAQGTVVLRAIIGRDGAIRDLTVVSGNPLLTRAAAEAVLKWRYRPYFLGNQPVEVETQVIVNFVLSQ